MAVNYDNLFENIGEYVERVNEFSTIITNLGSSFAEVAADLQANGADDILDGEFERFEQYKGSVLSWIAEMQTKITELLLDKNTVTDELIYGNEITFQAVISALFSAMVDDVENIAPNTVTLGAVTLDGTGTGELFTDKVLDGVSPPTSIGPAIPSYNGLDSEMALTDDMSLVCITDSYTDGAADGGESFQWAGRETVGNNYSWLGSGSGTGPIVTPLQSGTNLSNMEFQNFSTTDTPDSWTIATGTVNTHINEDTTVHRGTKCLQLTGDASLAEIKLTQAPSAVVPNKRYMVGFFIRGQAGTSSGTLTIQFEGTGYTAGTTEKITLNAAALAALTTYDFKQFWVTIPAVIPSDFVLAIKWSGTPSAHSVRLNGGGMKEATYFNGHCAMVVSGNTPFVRGDEFTYTVTNDYSGVFQTAFAKLYSIQLPSDAIPSQADSLAN